MPVSKNITIVCPSCGYRKTVTRGDCLPDASMFQKCPKCNQAMKDCKTKHHKEENYADIILTELNKWFKKD